MNVVIMIVSAMVAVSGESVPAADDFAIRDGDTVVFLGDSITAARTYGKFIEQYTLLRYPERKARFINAGWGGDTAAGGLKRLERDVLSHGATLVTVAYGINDIGWGGRADDEHKQAYLDGVRGIVTKCRERGVRVYICSASITGADPDKSENDYLQKMCDEGMAISRSLGGESIDVQRTMREMQRRVWDANARETDPKKKTSMHAGDGIHLNDLGQLAMAYAILKGLGAPADVTAATLDATEPKVVETTRCQVIDVTGSAAGVEFTRLDEGLPLNWGLFWGLNFRFVPIPEEINRYMLTVRGLKPGQYTIAVNERGLGTFPAERLAAGINIGSATADGWEPGGPWDAQGWALKMPTEARNELDQVRKLGTEYLDTNPHKEEILRQIREINERIESVQRLIAQPVPYRFVIRPAQGN